MGTIKTTFSNNIDATGKLKEGSLGFSAGTSWQAVKTTSFTAVAGEGYFVDTTSGAITVTLPSSPSAGDYVVLKDYARTWATNNVLIASALFEGTTKTNSFSTDGQTVTLVYMDGTKGWSLVNEDTTTGLGAQFVTATGGTVTTSGDYKIHTFTGDGCFVVSCGGNPSGSTSVDYLVVAGGGSGGNNQSGGGGAGGYRESSGVASGCYSASPLGACVSALPVSVQSYPITVGGGGSPGPVRGNNGSDSIFSTITSTGGGGGDNRSSGQTGLPGGSGGGAGGCGPQTAGSGNTPPVSPPQGNPGGNGVNPDGGGGGGGGAGGNGSDSSAPRNGGNGAIGVTSSINTSATVRAAGGGGGAGSGTGGTGGSGIGGNGGTNTSIPAGLGTPGTINTGSGGGGGGNNGPNLGGNGGSGIVIIRYKYQ